MTRLPVIAASNGQSETRSLHLFDDIPSHAPAPDLRARLELAAERMTRRLDTRDPPDPVFLSRTPTAAYESESDGPALPGGNGASHLLEWRPFRPFADVAHLLLADPDLLSHFCGANHKAELDLEIGPEPADASLRERWPAARDVAQLLKQRFAPVFALEHASRRAARKRKLSLLAEHDPLFERTLDMLYVYREMLTPACRKFSTVLPFATSAFAHSITSASLAFLAMAAPLLHGYYYMFDLEMELIAKYGVVLLVCCQDCVV